MTATRCQHTIALTQEEELILEALQEDKIISVIGIFRKGLEFYAPKASKDVLEKIKKEIFKRI